MTLPAGVLRGIGLYRAHTTSSMESISNSDGSGLQLGYHCLVTSGTLYRCIGVSTTGSDWTQVTAEGSGGGTQDELIYYSGYSTASLTFSGSTWSEITNVVPDATITDVNEVGITRTNSSWNFVSGGVFFADVTLNAALADRYFGIRLRSTTSGTTLLQQVDEVGASQDTSRGKLSGLFTINPGEDVEVQYVLDTTSSFTWNSTTLDGEQSRTAYFNFYSICAASGTILQSGGGSTSLDTAYDNGRTVTVDVGAIQLQGSLGSNTLEVTGSVDVDGAFSATSKSFLIDHPNPNKKGKLRHGSLEGPEHGVYIRGEANNLCIQLPDYWQYLVDYNSITVDLTPIGFFQPLYLKDIDEKANRIIVGCDKHIINTRYFYRVNAERIDVPKLEVEE